MWKTHYLWIRAMILNSTAKVIKNNFIIYAIYRFLYEIYRSNLNIQLIMTKVIACKLYNNSYTTLFLLNLYCKILHTVTLQQMEHLKNEKKCVDLWLSITYRRRKMKRNETFLKKKNFLRDLDMCSKERKVEHRDTNKKKCSTRSQVQRIIWWFESSVTDKILQLNWFLCTNRLFYVYNDELSVFVWVFDNSIEISDLRRSLHWSKWRQR